VFLSSVHFEPTLSCKDVRLTQAFAGRRLQRCRWT